MTSQALLRPLSSLVALAATTSIAHANPSTANPTAIVSTTAEPVAPGKFQPRWEPLRQYEVPGWFRDVKFGIWAASVTLLGGDEKLTWSQTVDVLSIEAPRSTPSDIATVFKFPRANSPAVLGPTSMKPVTQITPENPLL